MKSLRYHIVDVFTDRMFGGNPLAVFVDGTGLSGETMQLLAKEMNLSETTFVLPPDDPANHFHVRIFTPGKELPAAGHPTVGTSFVLVREGMVQLEGEGGQLRLEEGIGLISVDVQLDGGKPGMIWMTQPLPKFGTRLEDPQGVAQMLSLDQGDLNTDLPVEVVSVGVPFLYVPVRSLDAMRRIKFRQDIADRLLEPLQLNEVFVFAMETENEGSTVHSRMFAPSIGVWEDPATGIASGPLGSYLVRYNVVPASPVADIVSEQGIEMGRPSFIHIRIEQQDGDIARVQIGGKVVYVGSGEVELED